MPEWVITLAWAIAPSLFVSIIMACWNQKQNKRAEEDKARDEMAREKDSLEISLLVATAELSYAVVMAMKRGSTNGEVEIALRRYNRAMDKFREFERKQLGYVE